MLKIIKKIKKLIIFYCFCLDFKDYDELFIEKLGLLLKIRENEFVSWSGSEAGNSPIITFIMNENKLIYAEFRKIENIM